MNQVIEQTFNGVSVNMDGSAYQRCQFVDCTLVYSGGEIPSIENCAIANCSWQFADAAHRTLRFLSAFYISADPAAKQLVEQVFNSIRTGV